MLRELCTAILPAQGLGSTLQRWPEIAKGLAESKRQRKRYLLK
jgi:hypothetical protein